MACCIMQQAITFWEVFMEHRKDFYTICIFALVFCLLLRILSLGGVALFQDPTALSLLVYLQTGRVVRYPAESAPEPDLETTLPPSTQATLPRPQSLTLSQRDGLSVQLNDLAGYQPNVEKLLLQPLSWSLRSDMPTVLILHTHATESYTMQPGEFYEEDSDYRTLNASYNMLSVGEELAKVLEAGGISVLHDRTLHDYPSYSGSYDHARATIAKYLEAYPSIVLVIDLHRDALDFDQDPQLTTLATVNGRKSAQLMLVAGTDKNVPHANWQENLALNVKLTATLEKMHPGITRPIQLRPQRFNLDMTPGSILVEVGANGNTHTEAILAVRILGQAILSMSNGVNS